MKKGDKVTTTHVEGIFTVKSIDEKKRDRHDQAAERIDVQGSR